MANVGSISVGNKKWGCAGEYVGRPSPLGNPFAMKSEADRDRVCAQYAAWLGRQISERNPAVCNELNRLYRMAITGHDIVLLCWCAPKRCHAHAIKQVLEEKLNTSLAHKSIDVNQS